jgi:hypothetical protein
MPKPIKKKLPRDVNQLAREVAKLSTEPKEPEPPTKDEISRVMSELGRRGGKIGGKRRLDTLSDEQRREFASNAAKARWKKHKAAKPQ